MFDSWAGAARALFFAIFGAATLSVAAVAEEAPELGPKIGAVLPHDLATVDSSNASQSFESLVGANGMALFFVRSVDWCPFCKAQATRVSEARDEFQSRGLSVVFVSYDPPEKQAAFVEKTGFAPTLLSDPKSEIIDAFGLRNGTRTEGRYAGIPHPAVFIVAPDKRILAKLYESDYASNDKSHRNRPAVETILKAADEALADHQS